MNYEWKGKHNKAVNQNHIKKMRPNEWGYLDGNE